MVLRYVFARSGKGKSYYIHQDIRKALQQHQGEALILLVPEQYTLQAERDLIAALGSKGIMQVEVMSFSSLGRRVLQDAGGITRVVLNETGKVMVLKKIIDENVRNLTLYQTACRQEGFVEKLAELFSQIKQEDMDLAAMLDHCDAETQPVLQQKLQDIRLLYQAFNSYLQGRYLDPDDEVNLYIEKMPECSFLQGAKIWIDGFTTFSSQSLRLLEQLLSLAAEISISFTMSTEAQQRDADLFNLSRQSYTRVHEMAVKKGLTEQLINLDTFGADRFKTAEILHVETELYAYPFQTFPAVPECIRISAAPNRYQEVQSMACQLVELAREKGYRWNDMAVVCNDMDLYAGTIQRVFTEHGIPFFMDEKRNIMNNPIVRLILAMMNIVDQNYRYRDVFDFFKTGFSGMDANLYEQLENYALAYGIEGERWKHPFIWGEEELWEEVNTAREAFMDIMRPFEEAMRGRQSVTEFSRQLFEQLERMGTAQKVQIRVQELQEQGEIEQVYVMTQVWNLLLDMLDQMVEIMGDQYMDLRAYKRIIEAGFASYELGIIPTGVDQVLVGSIQRSKSRSIQILFVLGVNDGVLPSLSSNESLMTDEEIEHLLSQGFDLLPDRQRRDQEERFLLYNSLTRTQKHLFLSYTEADEEGRALRPSILIQRFMLLFPRMQLEKDRLSCPEPSLQLSTASGSFRTLVTQLRGYIDGKNIHSSWWDVYNWYYQHPDWQTDCRRMVDALFYSNQPQPIVPLKLQDLFASPIHTSVTQLERYNACPFSHFVQYGLRPHPRLSYEIAMPDIGQLFHDSLYRFGQRLMQEDISWQEVEADQCEAWVDEIMEDISHTHGSGVLESTYRYQYLSKRLTRICKRAIWTLAEHMKKGEFEPLGYELRFGRGGVFPPLPIELDDGRVLRLEGQIDRLDICKEQDLVYIKIIDYKTGTRTMDLSSVYYGLDMQLIVYLAAALRALSAKAVVKPAGVFYFPIHDPFVDGDASEPEAIDREIRKQLRLRGFALNDVNLLRFLDRDLDKDSDVIPVGLKKDGQIKANAAVLSEEEFNILIRYVEFLIKQKGEEMVQGKHAIEPVKVGTAYTACQRCDFASICQFDSLLADNRYRYLKPLNKDMVFRSIQEEVLNDDPVDD